MGFVSVRGKGLARWQSTALVFGGGSISSVIHSLNSATHHHATLDPSELGIIERT